MQRDGRPGRRRPTGEERRGHFPAATHHWRPCERSLELSDNLSLPTSCCTTWGRTRQYLSALSSGLAVRVPDQDTAAGQLGPGFGHQDGVRHRWERSGPGCDAVPVHTLAIFLWRGAGSLQTIPGFPVAPDSRTRGTILSRTTAEATKWSAAWCSWCGASPTCNWPPRWG